MLIKAQAHREVALRVHVDGEHTCSPCSLEGAPKFTVEVVFSDPALLIGERKTCAM